MRIGGSSSRTTGPSAPSPGPGGRRFAGFNPAISPTQAKRLRQEMRNWHLCRRSNQALPQLARWANFRPQGRVNSYGHSYRAAPHRLFRPLNEHWARCARREHNRLHNSRPHAHRLLQRVAREQPGLFLRWRVGLAPCVG